MLVRALVEHGMVINDECMLQKMKKPKDKMIKNMINIVICDLLPMERARERENKKQACLHFSLFSCGCLWLDMPQILRNMGFLCYFTSHSWVKLFKPQVFGGQRMADPKNSADTYLCCFRTPNEETTTEPREAAEVSHESSLPLRTQKFFTRTLEMSRNALLHRCDRGDTFCHWQLWVLSCSSMLPAPVGGGSN